jgi:hypothetical protein
MKKIMLVLFLGTIISTIANAQEQRFIEVVTEETMEVNPDEFIVEFRLSERTKYEDDHSYDIVEDEMETAAAEEATEAVEEDVMPSQKKNRTRPKPRKRIKITVQEQEQAIKDYLKKMGIPSVNLVLATDKRGYNWEETRRFYTLKINKLEIFAQVMNALDSMHAQRVKLQSFRSSKVEEYKSEMAVKALKKAQKQAQKLVGVYGEELGRVVSVSEDLGGHDKTSTKFYELIMTELMRKNKNTGFPITITYKVKVKFAIK